MSTKNILISFGAVLAVYFIWQSYHQKPIDFTIKNISNGLGGSVGESFTGGGSGGSF